MVFKCQFQKGDRVKVTSYCQSYGKIGTVIKCWRNDYNNNNYIEVKLEDGSTHNYNELSLISINTKKENNITKGDNEMITGNYKVAMVKFVQGTNTVKGYAFALFDEYVIVDDYVLCDTANGYGVAKVIDIIAKDEYDGDVTKEIICGVDFTNFEQRKKNREEAKKLKSEMDKKMKEMQELALYEMMAEKSPELREMLDTYKGLVG